MPEELRNRLKAARAKLGLSQSGAAKAWGLPTRTLIGWENNQHSPRGLALTAINAMLDSILAEPPKDSTRRPPVKARVGEVGARTSTATARKTPARKAAKKRTP